MASPDYAIEVERGRATARCCCGWASESVGSAGLAGALWDRHRSADHADDVVVLDGEAPGTVYVDGDERQSEPIETVSS